MMEHVKLVSILNHTGLGFGKEHVLDSLNGKK